MKPLLKPRVCCLLAHTLLSALPLCEVGAARAARWRTLLFHVRIGPQKLNQYEFRLAPADERVCFITAGPITKLFAWGRRRVEDMCYERRRAVACVD